MKTTERTRIIKLDIIFKKSLYGHILEKINTFTFWYMIIPWKLDYEVGPWKKAIFHGPTSCEICDGLLNSSWNHFGLHQGKNVRLIMEFEVPKRHTLRPTLSTNMVLCVLRWERQCFGGKKARAHGKEILL